jgi:hypothetical protein
LEQEEGTTNEDGAGATTKAFVGEGPEKRERHMTVHVAGRFIVKKEYVRSVCFPYGRPFGNYHFLWQLL